MKTLNIWTEALTMLARDAAFLCCPEIHALLNRYWAGIPEFEDLIYISDVVAALLIVDEIAVPRDFN